MQRTIYQIQISCIAFIFDYNNHRCVNKCCFVFESIFFPLKYSGHIWQFFTHFDCVTFSIFHFHLCAMTKMWISIVFVTFQILDRLILMNSIPFDCFWPCEHVQVILEYFICDVWSVNVRCKFMFCLPCAYTHTQNYRNVKKNSNLCHIAFK